ncbi:MAG: glycoside hydrolase family 38 C-terminal domain-containing protein, partial [Armatimonadota bacterium]|nr:glycoside hydrolase family 38 C-terminal domain-containing protein [Armatimonadota bacterium]
ESSEEIANTLKGRAQKGISIKAKLGKIPEGAPVFSVWNPSTHARSGLVEVILEAPKDWPKQSGITIIDAKGNRIAAQTVAKKTDEDLGVTFFTMRSHTRVNPRAFSFWADDLPALGYRIYAAIPEETPAKTPLKWGANWAENEFVMFKIAGNGSLTVEDKTSGAIFSGAGMFEDGGDRGGGYHFEAPAKDTVITSKDTKAKVELVEAGPAQVRFRVEVVMRIPERLSVRRTARAGKKSQLKMVTYVTLGAGSKSIKFRTQVFNNAVDHRLRVIFPTGLKTDVIHVDGHFDVLERPISRDKKPWPTEHHLRWVELSDGATGLAVMNQGLPEYEVTDDKSRTICLTLFRSNTYMTKEWWPTIKTPQAEFIGKSEYEYAVYVHGGDWKKGAVQAEAEAAMLPAKIFQTHLTAPAGHDGELPSEQSFIAVDSNVAVTSIVKKADNRDSMVIRLYNPDKAQTQATIKTWKPIKKAYALNLWEEQTESLTPANGTLKLKIPAKKIVTVEIVV